MELSALPFSEYAFPGPLRDQLTAAVYSGIKTTTSSLHEAYAVWQEELPVAGTVQGVLDSEGVPRFATEIVKVEVKRMAEVDDAFAIAEGEGFAGAADWRAAHEAYWLSRACVEDLGYTPELGDDTLVVCETVRVLSPEELAAR
jgi:uncharacterized protein YhfF